MKINKTEQIALESGDSWIDGNIFAGKIPFKKIKNKEFYSLNDDELSFLNNEVEALCDNIDNEKYHNNGCIDSVVLNYLINNKFFALCIPTEYGGLGFSHLLHARMVEKLASRSIPVAVTSMVPNSLGPGELLVKYGTENQKNYWLPRLAKGIDIPCFALTTTNAGSDAAGSQDSYGIVQPDGSIKLFFEKRFITLAPIATCIGIAFRLFDPDHLWGEQEDLGLNLAIIERDIDGLTIGNKHNPLGVPFSNGPIFGKDITIQLSNIIGGSAGIGEGWKMLVECLGIGRAISLTSLSTGLSKKVLKHTLSFVGRRKQFGTEISNFQGIQGPLVEMASYTYLIETLRNLTLGALDEGLNPSVLSAIGKYHCTEMARKVLQHGMDINAGSAIILGERNPLARFYQSAPISITVEGANILTRSLIIFGQGLMKNHPYAYDLVMSLINKDKKKTITKGLGFLKFIGYSSIITPFKILNSKQKFEKNINTLVLSFAFLTNALLIIQGQSLKKNEFISGRMGDIFSYLYMCIALIKEQTSNDTEHFENLIEYTQKDLLFKIQETFIDILNNISAGKLLKVMIFPLGRRFNKPNDKLTTKVASDIISFKSVLDRLTRNIYMDYYETEILKLSRKKVVLPVKYKTIEDLKTALKNDKINQEQFYQAKELIKQRHNSLKVNHDDNKVYHERMFDNIKYDFRS